jgi:hypothetical protein
MSAIDTGDTVRHKPTGEKWLVACVEGERLSWCGWPEGTANVSDCELIQKAPPVEKESLLRRLADMRNGNDHRCRYARHALETGTGLSNEVTK